MHRHTRLRGVALLLTLGFTGLTLCAPSAQEKPADSSAQPLKGVNPGPVYKAADGQEYRTVIINGLRWFAQDLRAKDTPSGQALALGIQRRGGSTAPNRYESRKGAIFYNWPAAAALCPEGWRIPTEADWDALQAFLTQEGNGGPGTSAGQKLIGNEVYGISLPGFWDAGSFYTEEGYSAVYWSGTQWPSDARDNWVYSVNAAGGFDKLVRDRRCAYSLRFVQDYRP